MDDGELLRFKQSDLRQYAASVGFVVDRRESCRGNTVMRCGPEKIIVSRKPDGVYTFWSPHDDTDRGTILDFVQRRNPGLNLGGVRKELRAWLGSRPPALPTMPGLTRTVKDLDEVRRRYAAMLIPLSHPYLEHERHIPSSILHSRRFAGQIRIDQYGAAVFPHFDAEGEVCGYELKNRNGFTGFAPGGRKGMWSSNVEADDRRLVLVESAIDALSHSALFDDANARYGSIGGKPTALQLETIRRVFVKLPEGCEVVAAMDADGAGRGLSDLMENVYSRCDRRDLLFRREVPVGVNDWNDILRARKPQPIAVVNSTVPQIR